jgi:hypothetical protein
MPDLQTQKRKLKLKGTRQEIHNLTILGMKPGLAPEEKAYLHGNGGAQRGPCRVRSLIGPPLATGQSEQIDISRTNARSTFRSGQRAQSADRIQGP